MNFYSPVSNTIEDEFRVSVGSEFQRREPMTEKPFLPSVMCNVM